MRPVYSLSALALAMAVAMAPREADACGGTFCDAGPNTMPVDQTGENILFVMGDGFTEAHIQIQYDPNTEAAKFAWLVPMTLVPEFEVGSQRLFDNVLAGTVPAYGFNYQFDSCGGDTGATDPTAAGDGGGGDSSGGGETGDTGGPTVVLQQTVGAFDITVLEGGTAAEVMTWLGDNDYQQDPAAEPILEEYLAENYVFAAFKLTNGAQIGEIHPIALRFATEEACVPIRLTRIAAVDDMEIRTFFLADARVVPQTYKHVLVNPLKLDWVNFASNYKEIITLAVDAFEAEGRAFVTEYAGSVDVVAPDGISSDAWDASAFANLAAVDVIDTLTNQGLMFCEEFQKECVYRHALVPGLLAAYLPVPEGLSEYDFYSCVSCNEAMIDLEAWGDGTAFSAAMQQRIVDPGNHAASLLATYPTLTRMYTTMSPHEMTADPFFWANPDLPEVDLTQSLATRRVLCNGDAVWTLPDGREVYVPDDGAWPMIDAEMPYEEEVAQMTSSGAPQLLVDNKATIDTQLREYNCALGWPGNECGAADTGDDAGTAGTAGSAGSAASDGASESSGDAPGLDDGGDGCGCSSSGGAPGLALAPWLLVLAGRRRGGRRPR